jgi:hypothetical protein
MKHRFTSLVVILGLLCLMPMVVSGANIQSFTNTGSFEQNGGGVTYSYLLNVEGTVVIDIYNTATNIKVKTFNEGLKQAGTTYSVLWDGKDDNGNFVMPDSYTAVLTLRYKNGEYEYATQWGGFSQSDPDGLFVGLYPQDLTVDNNGFVYVPDSLGHALKKFDSNGNLIKIYNFGPRPIYPQYSLVPLSIAYNPTNDEIYTQTYYSGDELFVYTFNPDLDLIGTWDPSASTSHDRYVYMPALSTDPIGNIYLIDAHLIPAETSFIGKFDISHNLLYQYTIQPGYIGHIAVASSQHDYRIYCLNWPINGIVMIDKFGQSQGGFGGAGSDVGKFSFPIPSVGYYQFGLTLDKNDNVYVADTGNNRIQKFTFDGTYLANFGQGQLNQPHGVAVDNAGNVYIADSGNYRVVKYAPTYSTDGASNFVQILPETNPPVTTIHLTGTQGYNNWYISDVGISFEAYDLESGVAKTEYWYNLIIKNTYTAPFTDSIEGTKTISYRSTDNAGNVETTKKKDYKIDKTHPSTALTFSGTPGDNGWYRSDVTCTLTPTDPGGSGVVETLFSYDQSSWDVYTNPFKVRIMDSGLTPLFYYSSDIAGNNEPEQSVVVKIDKIPPITGITLAGTLGPDGKYTSRVAITLTATDRGGSGIAKREFSFDGVTWQTSPKQIFVSDNGDYTIHYHSTDKAGNEELENTKSFTIQQSGPGPGPGPEPCSGSIGDRVWNDLNQNGIQDIMESGINGISIDLLDDQGFVIDTATTMKEPGSRNSMGYYQFGGLCAGSYAIRVDSNTVPAGMVLTSVHAPGSTPSTDSDPSPAPVTLATDSSSDDTIDFGFFIPTIALPSLTLAPLTSTNPVGTSHDLSATLLDAAGAPLPGKSITFIVIAGPHTGTIGSAVTDNLGKATISYTGVNTGTDTIVARYAVVSSTMVFSNQVSKVWTTQSVPTPEFPSAFLPATMIIGFLGAVLLIQRTREH